MGRGQPSCCGGSEVMGPEKKSRRGGRGGEYMVATCENTQPTSFLCVSGGYMHNMHMHRTCLQTTL